MNYSTPAARSRESQRTSSASRGATPVLACTRPGWAEASRQSMKAPLGEAVSTHTSDTCLSVVDFSVQ
jgi:hypothetical protein